VGRRIRRRVSNILDRDTGGNLELAIERGRALHGALFDLLYVLNDFTGSDLRAVDLAAVPLGGVLWSETTQWPPDLRRASPA